MKRIIDGRTYNTATASRVGRYEYEDHMGHEVEAEIYLTRGGDFFITHEWKVDGETKRYLEPISREELQRFVEKGGDQLELFDDSVLAEPPEAGAEAEPGTAIYVRLPAALKRKVDEAAKAENVSVNAWATRCLERCAGLVPTAETRR